MPQPFVLGGYSHHLTCLKQNPEAAQHIGLIVSMWAVIEMQMSQVLSCILGADANIGSTIYTVIKSEQARLAVIQAIAEDKLSEAQNLKFASLKKRITQTGSQRDSICHNIWAISYPDNGAILMDARKTARKDAAEATVTALAAKYGTVTEDHGTQSAMREHHDSLLRYSTQDFIDIEERIAQLSADIISFYGEIHPRSPAPESDKPTP